MIPALVVDALAAYRLTRLVTADVLTKDLRGLVIEEAYARAVLPEGEFAELIDQAARDGWDDVVALDDDPPKLATLVTCRWCTGVWIAAGVIAARRVIPRQWAPVADMLAVAAAAALIARAEDD